MNDNQNQYDVKSALNGGSESESSNELKVTATESESGATTESSEGLEAEISDHDS